MKTLVSLDVPEGYIFYEASIINKHVKGHPSIIAAKVEITTDMVLHCPRCGVQHIDEPKVCHMGAWCKINATCNAAGKGSPTYCDAWTNPPHRSHLCATCGCIWRPADIPTNGVKSIETKGKADNFNSDSVRYRLVGCTHNSYKFSKHGRCCPECHQVVTDFGD